MTAATIATLMKGVAILKKTQGSPLEKTALDSTVIDSNSGTLTVDYSSSDSQSSVEGGSSRQPVDSSCMGSPVEESPAS